MKHLSDSNESLEEMWDGLLSREQEQVRSVFTRLTAEEQSAVLAHLHRMVEEPGWHPEQRLSAQAALQALVMLPDNNRSDSSDN